MELLRCENLSLAYEGVTVASDINFCVENGDYLSIVGENGSGKSTLIKGILGFVKQSGGKILYENGLKRTQIGYLPQQTAVRRDFPASVYEVVMSGCLNSLGARAFFSHEQKEKAQYNMERLGIADLKKRCFRELSGGQRQRTLLARALCSAHSMLLLDEPSAGLDPDASDEMYSTILSLNEQDGLAIIMVSHDIKRAVSDSKHILHLHKKQLFYGKACDYNVRTEG